LTQFFRMGPVTFRRVALAITIVLLLVILLMILL
jgi:hypothetical protein